MLSITIWYVAGEHIFLSVQLWIPEKIEPETKETLRYDSPKTISLLLATFKGFIYYFPILAKFNHGLLLWIFVCMYVSMRFNWFFVSFLSYLNVPTKERKNTILIWNKVKQSCTFYYRILTKICPVPGTREGREISCLSRRMQQCPVILIIKCE